MKRESPSIGCRVSHEVHDRLIALCEETGDSKSKILNDALCAYLGMNPPESAAMLGKRVAALERQFKKLMQMI